MDDQRSSRARTALREEVDEHLNVLDGYVRVVCHAFILTPPDYAKTLEQPCSPRSVQLMRRADHSAKSFFVPLLFENN